MNQAKREYNRQYYIKHREEMLTAQRAYNAAHPGLSTKRYHLSGRSKPMSEAIDSAAYLGVHVAERALAKFFDNIIRMPYGNPGYDFLCGRGFKIDVKSSCLRHPPDQTPPWTFSIGRNTIADYFLCLAFDDRKTLTPMHVWLIPGEVVNDRKGISIADTVKGLARYSEYERPLDKVIACCASMRSA